MSEPRRPRDLLIAAATRLGRLRERVVFVGGATTELLVTDPGAAEARATNDVDVIVEVATHAEYVGALRDELVALGFREHGSSRGADVSLARG